jgi:general secretion pathway protein J
MMRNRGFGSKGFTLVEVMVAIGIMALMAMLSWRGIDGMARSQATTQVYADEVQTLQTGLAQWGADLDAMLQLQPAQQINAIDWDGRVLRLTRRSSNAEDNGLLVVAWTRRIVDGTGQWLRWQSPPLRSRAALTEAWQRAGLWAQNPGDEEKKREVAITPLEQWQIFYFRNDAWSNPLSSDGAAPVATTGGTGSTIPAGLRLVLTLPQGAALGGTLTRDWVAPTVGGGKS